MEVTTEAFRFFEHNAGYATPPGRAVCAFDSARAEAQFKRLESLDLARFVVEDEDDYGSMTDEQGKRLDSGETVYLWARIEVCGETLASLGGIEVLANEHFDGSSGYLRVIRAELAGEAFAELDERAAKRAVSV